MGKGHRYGTLLREWREASGFTQAALAKMLDTKQGCVCAYETSNRLPELRIAVRLDELSEGAVPVREAFRPKKAKKRSPRGSSASQ